MNPHDYIGCREVWWNELKLGEPIELEIIDYFRADEYIIGKGRYVAYHAESLGDYLPLGILKGDRICFFVSSRCYVKALRKLKSECITPCQRKFAEGKNLHIKLEKLNSERILIHMQEPREPTEDQLKEAEIQYKMIRKEHGMRIK